MKIFIIIKRTRKRPFNKSGCAVPFTAQTTTFKNERLVSKRSGQRQPQKRRVIGP